MVCLSCCQSEGFWFDSKWRRVSFLHFFFLFSHSREADYLFACPVRCKPLNENDNKEKRQNFFVATSKLTDGVWRKIFKSYWLSDANFLLPVVVSDCASATMTINNPDSEYSFKINPLKLLSELPQMMWWALMSLLTISERHCAAQNTTTCLKAPVGAGSSWGK